jgi:hypothetical protein
LLTHSQAAVAPKCYRAVTAAPKVSHFAARCGLSPARRQEGGPAARALAVSEIRWKSLDPRSPGMYYTYSHICRRKRRLFDNSSHHSKRANPQPASDYCARHAKRRPSLPTLATLAVHFPRACGDKTFQLVRAQVQSLEHDRATSHTATQKKAQLKRRRLMSPKTCFRDKSRGDISPTARGLARQHPLSCLARIARLTSPTSVLVRGSRESHQ